MYLLGNSSEDYKEFVRSTLDYTFNKHYVRSEFKFWNLLYIFPCVFVILKLFLHSFILTVDVPNGS